MRSLRFRLDISPQEALKYYRGQAKSVIAKAENGQTISFPAQHVRPFVEQNGIHGVFIIEFDAANKFMGIKRLSA